MLDGTGVRRNVTRITIHPNWNAGTFDNDVAVWELATNAAGAAVATLASDDGAVGANLLATGWGHLRKVEAARLIFEESNYLSSRERTAMMQIHTMAKLPTT